MAARTLFHDPPQEALSRAPGLRQARRRQDRLQSVIILGLLGLPLLVSLLGVDTSVLGGAKRKVVPFPTVEVRWSSVGRFGKAVQTYFQDNFGFRSTLIRAHALLHSQVLGISPSETVLWGRDGWLFYADDGGLEDIIADTPFGVDELEHWRRTLTANRDWLRARGIEYVFTLAPDKHVIYPEFLPPTVHRTGKETRLDQLAAYLRDHTDLVLVDLATPLVEAKARERVYDRTDTHWNARGAYVGYEAIMDAVARHVPGVEPPWPRREFSPERRRARGQDLAVMLGLSDVLAEEVLTLAPLRRRQARVVEPADPSPTNDEAFLATEIAGSEIPRAVVFRDSFMSRAVPYISEHFSRTVYVWQNDLDPAVVVRERPAIVIHEIVGRHLGTLVPYAYQAVREGSTPP